MSDSQNDNKKEESSDKELDALLDSALQDMTKKKEENPNNSTAIEEINTDGQAQNVWSDEFIKEAAAQFETNMAAILGSVSGVSEEQITQEQIAETFTKMAEAAALVMRPQNPENNQVIADTNVGPPLLDETNINDVTAAIAQTLQGLSTGSDNLQTPFNDADLANMFSQFNLDGQDPSANMFLPFMQGMMQSLLSKEVLYPSLKELVDKYPTWLDENKNKLDKADYDRYVEQKDLMLKVCAELEAEQESDSDQVKHERFTKVLTMMQTMQDLGQPPTDLVGDVIPPPQLPTTAPPPGADAQCVVM